MIDLVEGVVARYLKLDEKFLTPEELVARYKGRFKLQTLKAWRYRKRGPRATKLEGRIFYALADVEAWEANNQGVELLGTREDRTR